MKTSASIGNLRYFAKDDVLYYLLRTGPAARTREVQPGVTLEYDTRGRLLGMEILDASRFLKNFVLRDLARIARHAS